MGGGGSTLDFLKEGDISGLHETQVSQFEEDPEANILLMGAPQGLRTTSRDLGLDPEDIEDPTLPGEADVLTEEEIAEQAERAREFELIRSRGFQGRGSTIKSGSTGTTSNIQTTFKQLSGR